MKRTKEQSEESDEASAADEAAMDIDDDDDDDDNQEPADSGDDDDDVPPARPTENGSNNNLFFDTFYGLSSMDPSERSQAARDMLDYCLIGASANAKDASYALKRLFNGLCSGRAGARQGNASALAMFLKLSYAQGSLKEIQMLASSSEEEKELSLLAYVRHRLLGATNPGEEQGKRKGSEDRDYKFGLLFGILAIVKSGIMLPTGDTRPDATDILATTTGFVKDLSDLYAYKKWMREPAAHAIGTLLSSYYAVTADEPDAKTIVDHLVKTVIVPELLSKGDSKGDLPESESESWFATYSAEQAAIAVHIQTHVHCHSTQLPSPLDEPVLTPQTVLTMAVALSETSSVTHPRTHLFWDAFASYITERSEKSSTDEIRTLRSESPVGAVSPVDLIDAVVRHVIIARLVGLMEASTESTKSTHERSALGLCLVRSLTGVEFVSSITGRTRLLIDADTIERFVLKPPVVKYLFANILSSGSGGRKKHCTHLLRPLALQVLESIVETMAGADDSTRRLAVVRPLLLSDSRFDSKTKTSVVDQLMLLSEGQLELRSDLWNQYLAFLEVQILKAAPDETVSATMISQYEAQGFVDLVAQFVRALSRCVADTDEKKAYISNKVRSALGFLMASSFFDCKNVQVLPSSKKKKKGKKGSSPLSSLAVEAASFVKGQRKDNQLLPYQLRCALSSRFYSVVAECVASLMHSSADSKDREVLDFLSYLSSAWRDLDAAGALSLGPCDAEEGPAASSLRTTVTYLQDEARGSLEIAPGTKMQRFTTACSTLGTTLFLYLLDCGSADSFADDDIDADAENDAEEVGEYLADLKELCRVFTKPGIITDDDPMSSMADLCAAILSSPLATGSNSKGGFPKLLREAVKVLWISALNLAAEGKDAPTLHPDVISIVLRSIGVDDGALVDGDKQSDDDESDSESGTVGDSDDSVDVFTRAAQDPAVLGDDPSTTVVMDVSDGEGSGDVEINPDRLRSFLEEDSDADVDETELEHHEGADAALAKLIQIKQEARKAGQMARERTNILRQLRCSLLLETLLNGKPDGWGSLLSADVMLQAIYPILCYRRELEKSLLKSPGKSDEKRNMVEKLTVLLKTKIFKMKYSDHQWTSSIDRAEFCSTLAAQLVELLKAKVSKEQRACCSLALTSVVRAAPGSKTKLKVGEIYDELVGEWSTKRTTRLESSVLDDFIQQCPFVAQATLCIPLARAVASARSSFLKMEATRLLSLVYNANLNPRKTELEKDAFDALVASLGPVLDAFASALQEPETKKAKRGKEVLKALTKIFTFISTLNAGVPAKEMDKVKELLSRLKENTDSQPLDEACSKLLALTERMETPSKSPTPEPHAEVNPAEDSDEGNDDEPSEKVMKPTKQKKDKKKKGSKRK